MLFRYKYCSPVSAESCEGIELVNLLLYSIKLCSPVSVESWDGIDLDRLLTYSDKLISPVKELIDGDIVPFKLLLFRSN